MLFAIMFVLAVYASTVSVRNFRLKRTLKDTRETASRLIHTLKLDCIAWEKGIEDQAEAYEMQFLSLNEKVAAADNRSAYYRGLVLDLAAEVYMHRDLCLPIINFESLIDKIKEKDEDTLWAEVVAGE